MLGKHPLFAIYPLNSEQKISVECVPIHWLVGSLKLGWVTVSLAIQKIQASPRKSQLAKDLQKL